MRKAVNILLLLCMMAIQAYAQDADKSRRYDAFFLDAICQQQKGNNDAAFDLFRHCLEIDSTRSEAYYYLSRYYLALRQKDTALRYSQKAAELEPDNETYLETLANHYLSQGKYPEATATLERLSEKNRMRDDIIGFLVQLYEQQGD